MENNTLTSEDCRDNTNKLIENLTLEEVKERLIKTEDLLLRCYIELTSTYICPKCALCLENKPVDEITIKDIDKVLKNANI